MGKAMSELEIVICSHSLVVYPKIPGWSSGSGERITGHKQRDGGLYIQRSSLAKAKLMTYKRFWDCIHTRFQKK